MPIPEEFARQNIDALLDRCGWLVQDYKKLDLSASKGIAVREVRLKKGRCDYLLLIDRKQVGIIEAEKEGVPLSSVADQSGQYAENLPDFLRGNLIGRLPFLYESTGIETFFRDERDPHPRSRRVFAFHRPETLAQWRLSFRPASAARPMGGNARAQSDRVAWRRCRLVVRGWSRLLAARASRFPHRSRHRTSRRMISRCSLT